MAKNHIPLTLGKADNGRGAYGVFVYGHFIPMTELAIIAEAYEEGRVTVTKRGE